MKNVIALLMLLFLLLLTSFSDKGSVIPASIVFERDIYPIFQTKCNQGECHGDKGKAFPKYTSYGIIKGKSRKIAYRLNKEKDPMPPVDADLPLTSEERQLILDWIASGAPRD
ncbi:hypothetical protein [Phaeodactylibacter sp.]|jgi:uncharacterized membrane protein|uniref:hypothetical protein n=1 Tax=Phaeodactylibacter sp. TaxID=1940289 RepID=UPI0025F0999C|nr:hypothetical protein [Phaeodactylibacter sp.]MCI4647892.1 hypothetical protein [Phaeodactylibacter sp.]MCI5093111.1 hypothetical protein [Phaeodactylibacter sp.]